MPHPDGERQHPVHGVFQTDDQPTIVFVTVCTDKRKPWLATSRCHDLLVKAWREAEAWQIGRYVIMPDHLHLFASPGKIDISLENWIKFWKSKFSQALRNRTCRWQTDHWDRRLRSDESYESEWEYTRNNPVRHGLVERSEDWPYQGELVRLQW